MSITITTRINIVSLNTVEILSECKIRPKILIFEGPKYLMPLIEFIVAYDGKILAIAPEKLNHTDPLDKILEIALLDKHVKLPNLINLPVIRFVKTL